MEVVIDGQEQWGDTSYEELFRRILLDLGITRSIDKVRVFIRMEWPFFLISLKIREASGRRSITEVAQLEEKPKGTRIVITDESYAPRLLSLLWSSYGRERIDQLSRLEIMALGVKEAELSELMLDPEEEIKTKVLDAVWRLLPEGLKVRHNITSRGVITIAATEHEITGEWREMAQKIHDEMGGG